MFRHYLTMAFRTFAQNRGDTLTNLFGLTIGIASCLIILLFVRYELSYDRWLPAGERVYQLQLTLNDPEAGPVRLQMAPYPAAAALAADFPQIEAAAGSLTARPVILHKGVATLPERDALMADHGFFQVLAIPFLRGDPRRALAEAGSVVLSATEARRYFGGEDALGRVLTILHRGQRRDVRVTGVYADLPANSHLSFPMVFRLNPSDYADAPETLTAWDNISGYVYLKLRPGADAAQINTALGRWEARNVPVPAGQPRVEQAETYRLTPASAVHLGENQTASMTPGSDRATLITYGAVAALILAIACFNFVSLSTARATRRAREVGVRKVLGATQAQLTAQFLVESMLMVGLATLAALALVELALPSVGQFLGADLRLTYFGPNGVWPAIVGLALAAGLIGAVYPAFYLARFRPATVLRANRMATDGLGSGRLRAALATAQFSVVIGLIVCTSVIYAQTLHSRSLETGYERQRLLRIDNVDREAVRPVAESLIRDLRRLEGVEAVGGANIAPGTGNVSVTSVALAGRSQPVSIGLYRVDRHFFPAMGTKLLAGRGFSERHALDDSTLPEAGDAGTERQLAERGINIVVSARGAERLGFASPREAIGRQDRLGFIDEANGMVPSTIVGVVEDVRYRSAREEIEPMAYRMVREGTTSHLVLRHASDDPAALLARVRALWQARARETPFEAVFVEDALAGMYDREAARGHLLAVSTLLAIAIGCLGLFGLAAFLTERKTLEIGLRKVFGARVADIVGLLVWQFSRPVLFANLIAWPAAWYLMREWLNGYSERIALSPAYFLAAGLLALAIAAATIVGHTLKVARARPIEALRYE